MNLGCCELPATRHHAQGSSIMTRKILSACTLMALIAFMLSACTGADAKPPHFGFYLKSGTKLVEMKEFAGSPDHGETEGIPSALTVQPVIVAWHNRINPQWLQLISGYGEGKLVGYDTAPKADGLLELRPQGVLEPDGYCFVQGDPLGTPYQLATWCFKVSQDASSGQTPGGRTSGLWWVLLILLAAAAAGIYFIYRRGSQQKTTPADTMSSARSASPAFCMHCGQPVQTGSKFCLHCGKLLS